MRKAILPVVIALFMFASCVSAPRYGVRDGVERIGIISAMSNEMKLLLDNADIDHVDRVGGFEFNVGKLKGKDVVIVKAGVGKVLSAAAAATLANNYRVVDAIFTGIAGGVGDKTNVLDVVVASELVQHDYGTMTRNEGFIWWPTENADDNGFYQCDYKLADIACESATEIMGSSRVFRGRIATGDQFIASESYVRELQDKFDALACEMEGAAVASVCKQYNIPIVVIRCMSDKADGLARESISNMGDIAADNSSRIVMRMLEKM